MSENDDSSTFGDSGRVKVATVLHLETLKVKVATVLHLETLET